MNADAVPVGESRGRWGDVLTHADGRPYMTRWFMLSKAKCPWTPRIHRFHSSDGEVPHDHPADFFAMAVWGRAREIRYRADFCGRLRVTGERDVLPFVPRFTRAEDIHRIVDPKGMITIVVFMPYRRRWGFWPIINGVCRWVDNMEYKRERKA